MIPTLISFLAYQNRQAAQVEESPNGLPIDRRAEQEITYFKEAMSQIRSPRELVEDERLFAFVAKAFGYGDELPSTFVVQRALQDGIADGNTVANRSPDGRLRTMARTFGFAEFGLQNVRDIRVVEGIVERYETAITPSRQRAQNINPALNVEIDYFRRNIATVTSPDDFVGDFRLYQFAMEAFGLEERINDRALIRSALADGVSDETDLANRLRDPKLQNLVRVFGFEGGSTQNVRNAVFADTIIDQYTQANNATAALFEEGDPALQDRDIQYFIENISNVSTAEELVDDERLYRFVLTAFDLSSSILQKGLIRKVLEEGASTRGALANRLPDPRFRDLARAFAFVEYGTANIQDPKFAADVVERYQQVRAEIDAGQESPGVELAAYFQRKAPGLTSWLSVLADSRLRDVVFTTLDIPFAVGALDIDRQVAELENRFDVADLQDPDKLDAFLQRYTILFDAAQGSAATANPAAAILAGSANTSQLYSLVTGLA